LEGRIPQIRLMVKENGFRIAVPTFFRAKVLMNQRASLFHSSAYFGAKGLDFNG
jgi:hypothetical protein